MPGRRSEKTNENYFYNVLERMKNQSTLGAISMNKYPRVQLYTEVNAATWSGAVGREEEGRPTLEHLQALPSTPLLCV